MTRDEIIRMMIEACDTDKVDAWHNEFWTITQEELERFAALVAAAEREAILAACDMLWKSRGGYQASSELMQLMNWIRARGEK